ncbi:A24 family peptidase [Zophobihabitans entericus]|uniref:Flp operon protein B n=1 Tax=Zophobihabitans entericus TaxID=1635327 RepID=A0A6G9IBU9_9GAMM|nr:prepilin peptidase [Zophobihabitans entericus]QIQ21307.1 flp operon protein B [Zophobihabitans entericus]
MFNLITFFCAILPILIYICYTDIRYRKIYNIVLVVLLVITIINSFYFSIIPNWKGALIIFLVGLALFYLGGIGAGDIKLLAVLSLSVPENHIIDFILLISFCGLPLIAIVLFCYYVLKMKNKTIPYGVAINTGYFLLYFMLH